MTTIDTKPGGEVMRQLLDEIESLRRKLAATQSRLDELMLEYCPDEMSPEQLAEWGENQIPVED